MYEVKMHGFIMRERHASVKAPVLASQYLHPGTCTG